MVLEGVELKGNMQSAEELSLGMTKGRNSIEAVVTKCSVKVPGHRRHLRPASRTTCSEAGA